jgi:hypothetical protein
MSTNNELLDDILRLTREGRLRWQKVGPDSFQAPLKSGSVSIRFDFPMMGDERVSGADLAVVSVGRVILTFFSGTEGMSLVQQILAAGLPGWQSHWDQWQKTLAEARALLALE